MVNTNIALPHIHLDASRIQVGNTMGNINTIQRANSNQYTVPMPKVNTNQHTVQCSSGNQLAILELSGNQLGMQCPTGSNESQNSYTRKENTYTQNRNAIYGYNAMKSENLMQCQNII